MPELEGKVRRTRICNGRDTIVTGICRHDSQTVNTSPVERLQKHGAQFSLATGNLRNVSIPPF